MGISWEYHGIWAISWRLKKKASAQTANGIIFWEHGDLTRTRPCGTLKMHQNWWLPGSQTLEYINNWLVAPYIVWVHGIPQMIGAQIDETTADFNSRQVPFLYVFSFPLQSHEKQITWPCSHPCLWWILSWHVPSGKLSHSY